MSDVEPKLVESPKSQSVLVEGYRFDIQIYRLEGQTSWTLEVVDDTGTSHVWDDEFPSDRDARDEAVTELNRLGALGFMQGDDSDGDNVVPFRKN